MISTARFRKLIWDHYRLHGRHDLAWRKTKDPYKILISEVMLQQTQVSRVKTFYKNFIKKFPSARVLAKAKIADVLDAWQGLGYNRRALMLRRTAENVVNNYNGKLPSDRTTLESLPGIGRGTSGSLMAFAFNKPEIFIETNIRRVFLHHFFPERANVRDSEIEPLVARTLDHARPREWYWALMDYGAMLGEKARGQEAGNPNLRSKHYVRQSKFTGSDRELRGKLLRLLLREKKISARSLGKRLAESPARVQRVSRALAREGFLAERSGYLEML